MSEFDVPFCKPRVRLGDAWPTVFAEILRHLQDADEPEIASQFDRVWLPFQRLGGSPDDFSFMAYPVPVPSYNERLQMPFGDERSIDLTLKSGVLRIIVGELGEISWIYVLGFPDLYNQLEKYLPAHSVGGLGD